MPTPMEAVLGSCSVEPVWFVLAELSNDYDDERVRDAVTNAVTLAYGTHYDRVCFESGTGTQCFRSRSGAIDGEKADTDSWPVRTQTFSVPQNSEVLAAAIEAIRHSHSYEEPVIYILEAYATRADYRDDRANANRCWNRAAPE